MTLLLIQKWIRLATQVLVDLQWSRWNGITGLWQCPICMARQPGKKHSRDCDLGWLIGADTIKEEPVFNPANKPCQHEKVFSDVIMASYPAKRRWICRLCGETGVDRDKLDPPKETYGTLMAKFHGKVEAKDQIK